MFFLLCQIGICQGKNGESILVSLQITPFREMTRQSLNISKARKRRNLFSAEIYSV